MSTQKLEKVVRKELNLLNDQIDEKIIKGMSYAREARRHKFLLARLAEIERTRRASSGWLSRSFSFTSFMF